MAEKVIKAWGGFVSGKLHRVTGAWGVEMLAVYPTKEAAKESHRDFRRIEIREVED